VLVVEDDRELSATLADVLREYEYKVECFGDAAAALARVRQRAPAAIVLDLRMPGMNGLEFLAARAEDEALARVPVVVLSADPDMSEQARSLNVDAVLPKPVHLFLLLDAIQRTGGRYGDDLRAGAEV
jgi:CheY-like chemotaxis protein